ncbi:bifunctional isocitrate dehydrogenase kinase/phosphatase [soil metagenome]
MTDLEVANALIRGLSDFRSQFRKFSVSAKERFEQMLWHDQRMAVQLRMELHEVSIDQLSTALAKVDFNSINWQEVSKIYVDAYQADSWLPIAVSFYNSILRQAFDFRGLPALISIPDFSTYKESASEYEVDGNLQAVLIRAFGDFDLHVPFEDLTLQCAQTVRVIHQEIPEKISGITFHKNLFFRNKQAYAIGKLRSKSKSIPLAVAMVVSDKGVSIKAVLVHEESIKGIFSFSRSYFLLNSESPCGTLNFLLSVMHSKPRAQLLINLGYQELGKELLLQSLNIKIRVSDRKFNNAPGIRGMVMFVFFHPASNYVFKVVRGNIKPPKDTSEEEVIEKYRFVSQHDRVGRMADAQHFKNLALPSVSFDELLKSDLLTEAPETVREENGYLIFKTAFIERKLEPLNLYLQHHSQAENIEAILDYGKAIKEMVYSDIFPGDLLLKNFGVTNDKKVVFYDYDEVVALSDCSFKTLRQKKHDEEEYEADYQGVVMENDVFPEELVKFLVPEGYLRNALLEAHGELFSVEFWNQWKDFHRQGKFIDLQPYVANI